MDGKPTVASSIYPDCKHVDSLQVGAEFQDFVMLTLQRHGMYLQMFTSKKCQYLHGESFQGWEVKLDEPFTRTGRLSIEIAEKTKASNENWAPSGIYRKDNTWLYIQGNYEYFYVFMKQFLVKLHRAGRYKLGEIPTLQKFYLPISDAEKYGHKIVPDTDILKLFTTR